MFEKCTENQPKSNRISLKEMRERPAKVFEMVMCRQNIGLK